MGIAPTLTVENVIKFIQGTQLGESSECETKSSKRIVLKTKEDRQAVLELLQKIMDPMWGAIWDKKLSGSSAGGVVIANQITVLVKPIGGRSNPVVHELRNIDSLNRQIQDIMTRYGLDYVPIQTFDRKIHNVISIEKTAGTPKSDFHFINTENKECIWISHKKEGGVTAFQQWRWCIRAWDC